MANQRPAEQTKNPATTPCNPADKETCPREARSPIPEIPADNLSTKGTDQCQQCPAQPEKGWWEKFLTDPNAAFAGAVAIFTLALVFVGGWQARRLRQTVQATESAIAETRRIGEAQVRAYVHIKNAGVDFIMFGVPSPLVTFIASNSGQSPARNFLWNITLQYPNENIESILNPNWLNGIGYDVAANSDAPSEAALISKMGTQLIPTGTVITVIRLKIEYRFTDVFGENWFGETYFAGTMSLTLTPAEGIPSGRWVAKISQMPKPNDWDRVGTRAE